jgi:hypothetical protein
VGHYRVQQPKLAGNLYHDWQRELPDDNTYTHSYWDSNCNSHSNSATTYTNANSAPAHSYPNSYSSSTDPDSNRYPDANPYRNTNIYTGTDCSMPAATND